MNKIIAYLNLMRIFNPAGIVLLFFPCFLGYINNSFSSYEFIINIFLLSIFARSFGCVINDIVDAELDAKTERGKLRPIPSGALTKSEAIKFAIFLATVGIWILSYFDKKTILIISGAASLILIYPFLKRFTSFVQIFLGLVFNLGALITPYMIYHEIAKSDILIYYACVLLTICYDTIYAFADIKDDKKNKVYSLAILLEKRTKIISIIQFISLIIFCFGKVSDFKFINYVAIIAYIIFIFWQVKFFNKENSENAIFYFKAHQFLYIITGLLII